MSRRLSEGRCGGAGAACEPPVAWPRHRHHTRPSESECVFTTTCPARRVISQRNLDVVDRHRVLWTTSVDRTGNIRCPDHHSCLPRPVSVVPIIVTVLSMYGVIHLASCSLYHVPHLSTSTSQWLLLSEG